MCLCRMKILQEFLAVMKSRKQSKAWGNDDLASEQTTTILDRLMERTAKKSSKTLNSDNKSSVTSANKQKSAGDDELNQSDDGSSEDQNDEETEEELTEQQQQANQMSDLEYLRSKMNAEFSDSDFSDDEDESQLKERKDDHSESGNDDDDEMELTNSSATAANQSALTQKQDNIDDEGENESVAETGRIFVRNLPYACSEEDIRSFFEKYGEIADVNVPVDSSGRSKGFAYVTYMIPEHAVTALSEGDSSIFQGRILHILPAKPLPSDKNDDESNRNAKTYKDMKEKERKAKAIGGEERHAWNPLFMRHDTLLRSVAERMEMTEVRWNYLMSCCFI